MFDNQKPLQPEGAPFLLKQAFFAHSFFECKTAPHDDDQNRDGDCDAGSAFFGDCNADHHDADHCSKCE